MTAELSILLLADDQRGAPSTIHDHIGSFRQFSRHRVQTLNPRNLARSRFLDLEPFDVVVIHYSIVTIWDDYFSPWFRDRVRDFDGLKVQFLQDEYRWVDRITEMGRRLGIDVLYSVVPTETVDDIYGGRLPDTEILFTLTGYVPQGLVGRPTPSPAERPVDVGYRGRSLPFWLGRLGHEKIEIGRGFLEAAGELGLVCDIAWSESARIYGDDWYRWMAGCRSMLTSESGSSIVDFDGAAEAAVRSYLAVNPSATFEEVEASVLAPFAGGPSINTISPRVFETAAMRTALVMFPGRYSDVVREWEHFLPLQKDFSNIEEIAGHIRDISLLEEMTTRAYDDLIASGAYSYRKFIERFDDEMAARAAARDRRAGRLPAIMLRVEQASTGRSYHISALYGLARSGLLVYIALRQALRHPSLRRLALLARRDRPAAPGAPTLWCDVSRLALLTSIHCGDLAHGGAPFEVHPKLDGDRLIFTSRPEGETIDTRGKADMIGAIRGGSLSEIVWNHAAVGQYVTLPLPLVEKQISLDVGRYDAYGVYRFERLLAIARERPDLVVAALEPLLSPLTDSEANL